VREDPDGHRTLALGVAPGTRSEFRLAVRVQRSALRSSALLDRIRAEAKGEVDVRMVGRIVKRTVPGGASATAGEERPWHQQRQRPLLPGASVSHIDVTAGTLGAFVMRGRRVHLLSNNHVLASEDRGKAGDPIVQPGTMDGGRQRRNAVATLGKWIRFRKRAGNAVDAALGVLAADVEYDPARLTAIVRRGTRALRGVGPEVDSGTRVHKVGRTTGATTGRVTAFSLDNVVVAFDTGNVRFDDQIEIESTGTRPFSDGGDSGSLIVDDDMLAVALLFAGSEFGGRRNLGLTYANPIGAVLSALDATLLHA
jgi:hypothetical protein